MSSDDRRPSRGMSLGLTAALVLVWGYIRLFAFETTVFPLTYAIPLLVCVWTRDRLALWTMAVIFIVFHTLKMFWLLPPGLMSDAEIWANYGATFTNVTVAALAVHAIILLRERLERALADVTAQAEELRAQGEELAQQNEELAEQSEELSRQTEELTHQSEELASQNEELQAQSEEIALLNEALSRREALLQTLLETARVSGTEQSALQHISAAGLDLFGQAGGAIAVFQRTPAGLRVDSVVAPLTGADLTGSVIPEDGFAALVMAQERTASLNDAALRPDLALPTLGSPSPFRAALCAPIRAGAAVIGAFAVYCDQPREWSEEEFRLAEWLADQCGRVLEALRVQSDLREADRRKSEFLATLSHELRNPLAPIRFALQLLEAGSERDVQAVSVLQRQVRQLVRLVDDLLDATRLSSNKVQIRKERVDLVPIVQHAVDAAKPDIEAARHTLTVALPDEPIWLEADAERLAQVVTNLLNNAARYTPAGGTIRVTASVAGPEVLLSVTDTGVGLAREDLERVFEMFTQVTGPGSGGLGIGLALVRGIVDLHGGRVEARSDGPGQGSEFLVSLPVVGGPPELTSPTAGATEAGTGCRVLVVDDNTDSAEMMAALLELRGHEVRVAHDGETALAVAGDWPLDAALLDIGLPGMSGYEVAAQMRRSETTRHVRLIALTGWGQQADRLRAAEAGFDAHLTKPADPDAILGAIGTDMRNANQSNA